MTRNIIFSVVIMKFVVQTFTKVVRMLSIVFTLVPHMVVVEAGCFDNIYACAHDFPI